MSAATAAFLRSGRRMRATVAPPTTVNRACYLAAELDPIADAAAGDPGICNGAISGRKPPFGWREFGGTFWAKKVDAVAPASPKYDPGDGLREDKLRRLPCSHPESFYSNLVGCN